MKKKTMKLVAICLAMVLLMSLGSYAVFAYSTCRATALSMPTTKSYNDDFGCDSFDMFAKLSGKTCTTEYSLASGMSGNGYVAAFKSGGALLDSGSKSGREIRITAKASWLIGTVVRTLHEATVTTPMPECQGYHTRTYS